MIHRARSLGGRQSARVRAAAGGAAAFGAPAVAAPAVQSKNAAAAPRYHFKKSINLWAFPYPERMSLEQCLQLAKDAGFDGIELNYDLDNDLSPKSRHQGLPRRSAGWPRRSASPSAASARSCSGPIRSPATTRPSAPGPGAGRQDDRGRPRPGDGEPAGRARAPCTFPGGPITSRCPTTSATAGPARPSASWCPRPRSWAST